MLFIDRISSFLLPVYILAFFPIDQQEKSYQFIIIRSKFSHPSQSLRAGLFREATFQADAYYDRMPDYSVWIIISITLIKSSHFFE